MNTKIEQRGFTLIELVVVITILGILAAFAVPRFASLEGQARVAATQALAGSVRSGASLAHALWLAQGDPSSTSVTMEGHGDHDGRSVIRPRPPSRTRWSSSPASRRTTSGAARVFTKTTPSGSSITNCQVSYYAAAGRQRRALGLVDDERLLAAVSVSSSISTRAPAGALVIFGRPKCTHTPTQRPAGFTLVELVVVIVILGIVAAFAAPRFFDDRTFLQRGYYEELVAALKYCAEARRGERLPRPRRDRCVRLRGAATGGAERHLQYGRHDAGPRTSRSADGQVLVG